MLVIVVYSAIQNGLKNTTNAFRFQRRIMADKAMVFELLTEFWKFSFSGIRAASK